MDLKNSILVSNTKKATPPPHHTTEHYNKLIPPATSTQPTPAPPHCSSSSPHSAPTSPHSPSRYASSSQAQDGSPASSRTMSRSVRMGWCRCTPLGLQPRPRDCSLLRGRRRSGLPWRRRCRWGWGWGREIRSCRGVCGWGSHLLGWFRRLLGRRSRLLGLEREQERRWLSQALGWRG